MEDVCTWFVPDLVVVLNGAGYVKLPGLEIAWEHIGLVKSIFGTLLGEFKK